MPEQKSQLEAKIRFDLRHSLGLNNEDFRLKRRKSKKNSREVYHLYILPEIVENLRLTKLGLQSQSGEISCEALHQKIKKAVIMLNGAKPHEIF